MAQRIKVFNIIDIFCGTGAISYGLKNYDKRFSVVGGIDIDKSACDTARANHSQGTFICNSIENFTPRKFEGVIKSDHVELVVGGPPCQGFSSLRPSRGSNIEDPRNSLYKNFLQYVRYFEPVAFLMENVIGLLSVSNGGLFNEIIQAFHRLGYQVDWRVLNAANYGVPQKRERLFVVGVNKSRVRNPVLRFPEPTHFFEGRVIGTRFKENYIVNTSRGMPALSVMSAISDLPSLKSGETKTFYATRPKNNYQKDRRRGGASAVTLHQAANHSAKMLKVIKMAGSSKGALPSGLVSSGYTSCYSKMDPSGPATTITVKFTSPASNKCIHPFQQRSISPREAARLQSFDDKFEFCGSKTDIASQIGNAVPPLLGEAFAPLLIENLEAKNVSF